MDAQLTRKRCFAGKGTSPIPPCCAVVKEKLRLLETILPQAKLRFWGAVKSPNGGQTRAGQTESLKNPSSE